MVDGGVFIGSRDFFFYALEADTGELRWKYETDDTVLGGANYVRTEDRVVIVFGSYDAKLYGFDAATGEKLWEYLAEDRINGTPAIVDGKAVFGGCDTLLHVVDAATGEGVARVELGSECHVIGSVALSEGRAYFGHHANSVVCADLAAEEVLWSYSGRGAFVSSPGDRRRSRRLRRARPQAPLRRQGRRDAALDLLHAPPGRRLAGDRR